MKSVHQNVELDSWLASQGYKSLILHALSVALLQFAIGVIIGLFCMATPCNFDIMHTAGFIIPIVLLSVVFGILLSVFLSMRIVSWLFPKLWHIERGGFARSIHSGQERASLGRKKWKIYLLGCLRASLRLDADNPRSAQFRLVGRLSSGVIVIVDLLCQMLLNLFSRLPIREKKRTVEVGSGRDQPTRKE